MIDSYGRKINYLRVSVTDQCNLACRYCMPDKGQRLREKTSLLTLDERVHLIGLAAAAGIQKIRFTGGEPLLWEHIIECIARVTAIPGIEEVSLTTNGVLFTGLAEKLKDAGVRRVNFSLDSLNSQRFTYITRNGKLSQVLEAIHKALEIGMDPVKINTVVIKDFNDCEVLDFVRMAYELPLEVRFIECMPLGNLSFIQKEKLVSIQTVKKQIETHYKLMTLPAQSKSGPAERYKLSGGAGSVGFIGPMTQHFCLQCNRLRLSATGELYGCLFSKSGSNLRLLLQNDVSDEKMLIAFLKTVKEKPLRHHANEQWEIQTGRGMYQIGG